MAGALRMLPFVLMALLGVLAMRASAAGLAVDSGRMAAGAAVLVGCDPNGVDTRFALDSTGRVATVSVHGLAAACAGGTLKLTLAGESLSVDHAQLALPAGFDGSTLHLAVSGAALPGSISRVHLAVEGP